MSQRKLRLPLVTAASTLWLAAIWMTPSGAATPEATATPAASEAVLRLHEAREAVRRYEQREIERAGQAERVAETARIMRQRPLLMAQAQREAAASERAEAAQVREEALQIREEEREVLAEARRELRDAARRVAKIQRARHVIQRGAPGSRTFEYRFQSDGEDKPRLGVVMGQQEDEGVKILSVTPEGPAQKAGLRSGDIVIAVNGTALDQEPSDERLHQFLELSGELEEGTPVRLTFRRDGDETQTVDVTPEKLTSFDFMPFVPNVDVDMILEGVSEAMPMIHFEQHGEMLRLPPTIGLHRLRDFELTQLDAQLGTYFGTDQGLLILGVPESMQEQLQRGDVLVQIDGREPKDVNHAFRILHSYQPGETVTFSVMRHQQREEIGITLPEASDKDINIEHHRHIPAPPPPPDAPGLTPSAGAAPHILERTVIKT